MLKSNYNIKYLNSFYNELNDIAYYITYNLNNKDAANKLILKVEHEIKNRSKNPESYEVYKSEGNVELKWYKIYINNFIVFYTIKNSNMIIAHIFYKKQDIQNLIKKYKNKDI